MPTPPSVSCIGYANGLKTPVAGGLPIGAVLVKQHVADVMLPGDHGSTFAGNPLVCHAANAVVDVISDPAFLSGVRCRLSDFPMPHVPTSLKEPTGCFYRRVRCTCAKSRGA